MSDRNNSEKVGEHVRIFQRGSTWHATYQFGGRQRRQSLKTSNKKTAIRNPLELGACRCNVGGRVSIGVSAMALPVWWGAVAGQAGAARRARV